MRPATGTFILEVARLPTQVTDVAAEGAAVAFPGKLSRAMPQPFTLRWTTGRPSNVTPVFEVRGQWDGGKAETGVGVEWGSAEVLQTDPESDTKSGLLPDAVDLDVGYGLVTNEGVGLLTTYGGGCRRQDRAAMVSGWAGVSNSAQ